ncbi:MAG: hypothetical protein R6U70_08515, partial [Bacillota bacterium]
VNELRDWTGSRWDQLEEEARDYAAAAGEVEGLQKEIATVSGVIQRQEGRLRELRETEQGLAGELEVILAAAGDDAERARERYNEWVGHLRAMDQSRARLEENLRQFGAGNTDQLAEMKMDADNRALDSLRRWRELVDDNPGLPEVEEADEGQSVDERLQRLDEEIAALEESAEEMEERRLALLSRQSRIEGSDPLNIARAEMTLKVLREQREEVRLLAEAIACAHSGIQRATVEVHSSFREYLERLATRQLRALTGVAGRVVTLGEEFEVGLESGGRPCALEQLSKGARDQLYLALRFAVADVVASEVRLPFIFDDPFVTWDAGRRENLRQMLQEEVKRRQVIVLSHSTDYAGWGEEVALDVL